MYLNSLLFPAPRSSYTLNGLKDELIWIPKFQKKAEHLNRLCSTGSENSKPFQIDANSYETPRSRVPQFECKIRAPFSPQLELKVNGSKFNESKFCTKKSLITDQQCQNHPKKAAKLNEISDVSFQETSSIYEEKTENNLHNLKENQFRLLTPTGTGLNNEKAKDLRASYNFSIDDGDSPIQNNGPMVLEKKFILTGNNSVKANKTSLPTRDSSVFTEVENTPYIRTRMPLYKKKSSMIRTSRTFDSGLETLERDCDYDEDVVSEHPDEVTASNNIHKYRTRIFSNPHHLYNNLSGERKAFTELSQYESEKKDKMPSQRVDQKPKISGRLSLMTNMQECAEYYIPCMILKPRLPTNKVIIYFHGNGEDVNLARELLTHVKDQLNITVIAVEYPGYGLYKGVASEEQVQTDAEAIYEYLTTKMSVHPRNIILFGRSIGSGPATWLASRKNIGALVLMSAFTSIRAVVQHLAGKWAQYLIKERFNNVEHIKKVTCPTFIVHGLKDKLIPYQHSQELYDKCKGLCELVLPKEMNHIEFDFHDDFTTPLVEFLTQIGFGLAPNRNLKIHFPLELSQPPLEVTGKQRYGTPRY